MASLNRVVLIGNLTRDVEVRTTPDGTSVANIGLAVNRPWTNKEGKREADYFTIVAWRKLAELCAQYISKGSPVAIEGRLQSRSWETQDGQKRTTIEVVADNVQFLSRSTGTAESTESPFKETAINEEQPVQKTEQEPAQEDKKVNVVAEEDNASTDGAPDDDVPF